MCISVNNCRGICRFSCLFPMSSVCVCPRVEGEGGFQMMVVLIGFLVSLIMIS